MLRHITPSDTRRYIRERMRIDGMTQKRLAALAGTTQPYLARVLGDESLRIPDSICSVLGIERVEIYAVDEQKLNEAFAGPSPVSL